MKKVITISQLSEITKTPVSTLRYYERAGLLTPKSINETNRYRQFDEHSVETVKFIQKCQSLGFSNMEITDLLSLNYATDCGPLSVHVAEKLAIVGKKIKELQKLRHDLQKIERTCNQNPDELPCPFLAGTHLMDDSSLTT